MKLVVGLGNPGSQYRETPHNVGFRVADTLAARWGVNSNWRVNWDSMWVKSGPGPSAVLLLKPQTYMNLSGEAVSCLVAKEDRAVEKLIVISDDLALPFGTIRVRPKGTHGGQNGLRSIISCLGTQEFTRVRIGIQPEHPVSDASRFVLESFAKGDSKTLEKVLDESADAVRTIITDGVDEAMARFN